MLPNVETACRWCWAGGNDTAAVVEALQSFDLSGVDAS